MEHVEWNTTDSTIAESAGKAVCMHSNILGQSKGISSCRRRLDEPLARASDSLRYGSCFRAVWGQSCAMEKLMSAIKCVTSVWFRALAY